MWDAIKCDYDDVASDEDDDDEEIDNQEVEDDDFDLGPAMPRSLLSGDENREPTMGPRSILSGDENSRMINEIHQKVVVGPQNEVRELRERVREVFKCVVCLQSPEDFSFCPHCKRYLGCVNCQQQLDRCPTCRAEVPATEGFLSVLIPGLSELLH